MTKQPILKLTRLAIAMAVVFACLQASAQTQTQNQTIGATQDRPQLINTSRSNIKRPIVLSQPAAGATVQVGAPLTFQWQSDHNDSCNPEPCLDPVELTIKDMSSGKVVYVQKDIRTNWTYPSYAPKLAAGTTYQWTIMKHGDTSPPFTFTIARVNRPILEQSSKK